MLKLYSYFRSSASYRVRLGLNFKQLPFETVPIHLLREGGEQFGPLFLKLNPMAHVPVLDHDGLIISESMAILEYLDEVFPNTPLFPASPPERAQVRQICELINSGIQPLLNLKVNKFLKEEMACDSGEVEKWNHHWIKKGLSSLEDILSTHSGTFSFKNDFSATDCFILPQCFSSRRLGVDLSSFPILARLERDMANLPWVVKSHPQNQVDFVSN